MILIDKRFSFFIVIICIFVTNNSLANLEIESTKPADPNSTNSKLESTTSASSTPPASSTPISARSNIKILEAGDFIKKAVEKDSVHTQNPYRLCWYVGDPLIITFPNTCGNAKGSYCNATIKCSADGSRTNSHIEYNSFCNTKGNGKCPNPLQCLHDKNTKQKLDVDYITKQNFNTIIGSGRIENSFSIQLSSAKRRLKKDYEAAERTRRAFGIEDTDDRSAQQTQGNRIRSTSGGFSLVGFLKRLFGSA